MPHARDAVSLGPLHLRPVLVAKPWGGRRLADLGRDLPDERTYGESWDVADLAPDATPVLDPASRVDGGPYDGATLAELVAAHGDALLGPVAPTAQGRFPLLVKLLDAREHLSVQVHPPASWVRDHPEHQLKTESWVVVDATDDADLMLGLVDGTTEDDVVAALRDDAPETALTDLLRRVPARVGDVVHLPAGTIHALGAGCLVAEVQNPSDTTFRLHDWTATYGREPRALHLDEGLACVRLAWEHNLAAPASPTGDGLLVDTEHYALHRHRGEGSVRLQRGVPRVVVVLAGTLRGDDLAHDLGPGGVVLLPACWGGDVTGDGDSVVLEAVPGTPSQRRAGAR